MSSEGDAGGCLSLKVSADDLIVAASPNMQRYVPGLLLIAQQGLFVLGQDLGYQTTTKENSFPT